jgi:hypothetical protein
MESRIAFGECREHSRQRLELIESKRIALFVLRFDDAVGDDDRVAFLEVDFVVRANFRGRQAAKAARCWWADVLAQDVWIEMAGIRVANDAALELKIVKASVRTRAVLSIGARGRSGARR